MMKQRSYSLKLALRRVVVDSLAMAMEAEEYGGGDRKESRQSCSVGNMPSELLREILKKVEGEESKWPLRKHLVVCAGVCRTWREAMKEVVQTPEVSGNITFPISVKQPGPRHTLLQCFIKRNRATQTYHLFLNLTQADDDGKFLLSAQKCKRTTYTSYTISLHAEDMSKGSATYMGKLRSNFQGTKFIVYDALPTKDEAKMADTSSIKLVGSKEVSARVSFGNYPVALVSYGLNELGTRGPRKMHCIMDTIPTSAIEPGGKAPSKMDLAINQNDSFPTIPSFQSISHRQERILSQLSDNKRDGVLVLGNKVPRWHQQLQRWCLNFRGRVTVASVKNFQLVASPENGETGPEYEKVILQFGKVGKDVFTMDYGYPLSAFQSFAICLSSFDSKIARE